MGDSPSSGKILFTVDDVLSVIGGARAIKTSPEISVEGFNWKLSVSGSSRSLFLNLMSNVVTPTAIWSVETRMDIKLLSSTTHPICLKKTYVFTRESNTCYNTILNETFLEPRKGFITDGKLNIEVTFTLLNIMGIRRESISAFDFTDSNDPLNDLKIVLLGGETIYAGKQYLAANSSVFKAMIYGDFSEKNKKNAIELKDVHRKDFIDLLLVIYPSRQAITDLNFLPLLALADKFKMTYVINQIIDFIIISTRIGNVEKIAIAEKFDLARLKEHTLAQFRTIADFKRIRDTQVFKNLSREAKGDMMEKLVNLL